MSSVRILVSYDGEWVASPEAGIFKFSGSKVKGMSVPKNIKFKGLLDKVYRLLTIDPEKFSVSMKVLYASSLPVPPAEVVGDDDVSFFICENSSKNVSLRTPLCVTLAQKSTDAQLTTVPETKEHTCEPIVNLASTEDYVPDVCADDVGTSSEELAPRDVSAEPQIPDNNAIVNGATTAEPAIATPHVNQTRALENPIEWVTTREELAAITFDAVNSSRKEATTKEILRGSSVTHSKELMLRQVFSSKKELQEKLSILAIKEGFEYRVKRSSSKLLEVRCLEKDCEWQLRAIMVRDSEAFKVKRLGKAHSCSKECRSNKRNRQATIWVIGQHIKSKCRGANECYKPKQIIEVVRRELGINLSYAKAWRVKVMALDSDGGGQKRQRQPGGLKVRRPKKQRVVEESGSSRNRCGNCGTPGHYRQTCSAHVSSDSGGTVENQLVSLKLEG